MNTSDFYKELMQKYALNEEQIRLNAIKQAKRPAWQTYWKPAAGVAAAVAVTVGAVAFTNGKSPDVDITVSPNTVLSASQRLREAEQNYYSAAALEEEPVDIYITFNEPVCYSDMMVSLSAVADSADISIARLYFANDVISNADEIREYALEQGDSKEIIGAKLCAFASHYRDIQDLSCIYLAELGSADINDETFVPVSIDDCDPLISDLPVKTTETQATIITTPFSFEQETSVPTSEEIVDADVTEVSESEESTVVPPETTEPELDDPDLDEEEEEPVPEETTVTTTETEVPVTEISNAGEIGLMTEIYQLNVENSLETFLSGDYAVVLTKNEVYVYTLGGVIADKHPAQVFELSNPKITYSDSDTVILTGCGADGLRNMVAVIDTNNGTAYAYDASVNLGAAEIGTIHYSPSANKYFIKAVMGSNTYIYEVLMSAETGLAFRPLIEQEAAVSLAGYYNDTLYLVISDDNVKSSLYAFSCNNGEIREISAFEAICKVKRSPSFESFIVSDGENSVVMDVFSGNLVPTDGGYVMVGTKNNVTYLRTEEGDKAVNADGTFSDAAMEVIAFEKTINSDFEVNEITTEKVVVVSKSSMKW
ncbi:MAG: hypothetical protein ACI4KR_03860 [Ruminiclostridium sp.]